MGEYPQAHLIEGERVVRVSQLPVSGFEAADQTYFTVMAYDVKEEGYFTYVNDPSLSTKKFNKALETSLQDLMVLARKGILHTSLINLFHAGITEEHHRPQDRGKYLWLIDLIRYLEGHPGAGDIYAWLKGLQYPNLRLSGLADFAEFASIDDLSRPEFPLSSHLDSNLNRFSFQQRKKITYMNYLGEMLLSFVLLRGERYRRADKWKWDNVATLNQPAHTIKKIFRTFYFSLEGSETAYEFIKRKIKWTRMIRQMALFMAKDDPYSSFLLKRKAFPEKVFGRGVEVWYLEDYKGSNGFLITESKKGYYESAFNQKFILEFLQRFDWRGDARLVLRTAISHVSTEETYWLTPFLKDLQLEYPQLYVQFFEEIVPNLGPVNGPLPLQELIKALYLFTSVLVLERSEQQDHFSQGTEFSNQAVNSSL